MPPILTSDDLDGIGYDAIHADDARPYVTELVDAVEQDRLADPTDVGDALALAAEIAEGCGDGAEALSLAARRVDATEGTDEHHAARGQRAELLLRDGRIEEGMRELEALRPRLTRDPFAADWLVDALTDNDRLELAEEWLSAAVATAMEVADRASPETEAADDAWEIVERLVIRRRWVRRDLGLAPDEADELAVEIAAADDAQPDLVFSPEEALTQVLAAFPDDDLVLGADWDAHRAAVEGELQLGDAEGDPPLVEVATPELLAAVLAGDDGAGVDPGPVLVWPPGRNEPCWCGSRTKYKKCCLPRGRS